MKTFNDKTIWITGASSGFGEALALEFAGRGAKIILSARHEEGLVRVKNKIQHAFVLPLDLSEQHTFEAKTQEAIKSFGHIDMIVHNAGVAQNATVMETSSEVERKIMEIDFFGSTQLTRYILPHFIERGTGHIVVVSGGLARVSMPKRSSYCAAKAALISYFDSLRIEVQKYNIYITTLIPGVMQTSLTEKAIGAKGNIDGGKAVGQGCPVDKAARQSAKIILKEKYESYVGCNDSSRMIMLIRKWFPSLGIKMVLKKFQ